MRHGRGLTPARRWVLALALLLVGVIAGLLLRRQAADRVSVIAASYPEGPLFRGATLYYAEMGADRVSAVQGGKRRPFFTQKDCGPTAIAPYGQGFLVLCHLGQRLVEVRADGRQVRTWEADEDGRRLMDPNDASADGRGGVYFSDPGRFSRRTEPHGRLMHLSARGVLRAVAEPLWYPNGVHVDQAHDWVYVSEHMSGRVLRFARRSDGSLEPSGTVVDLATVERSRRYETPHPETGPDGLEIGPNGDVYVAVYGEGRVLRFGSQGDYRGAIDLPTRYSTNIAFRPDGSAVTTGSDNRRPPYPGEVRFHSAEAMKGR